MGDASDWQGGAGEGAGRGAVRVEAAVRRVASRSQGWRADSVGVMGSRGRRVRGARCVPASAIKPAAASQPECVVELANARGAKMRVELSGNGLAGLSSLCSAFWT